jgi:hypothetical protein
MDNKQLAIAYQCFDISATLSILNYFIRSFDCAQDASGNEKRGHFRVPRS